MFATRFSPLIERHPQEADALRRVADYFAEFEARQGERVLKVRLDPHRLFDISEAGSASRLARITQILIDEGIFERRVIVRLPMGGGVEFGSYSELPEVIRDPLRDVEMEVSEENTEASYVVIADERH